jgi:hypothetical protein
VIRVHNRQIIENMPFDEYISLKRISHSFIKNPKNIVFTQTKSIHLGSQVDAYLNEHDRFEGDIRLVKHLASVLLEDIGFDVYQRMHKQSTIICDFEYKGLVMPYKGRTDWFYPDSIVIDIKIAKNLHETVDFFKYPNAMNGYSIGLEIPRWLLFSVSPSKIDPETGTNKIIKIPDPGTIDHYFWERQVLRFGKPLRTYITK